METASIDQPLIEEQPGVPAIRRMAALSPQIAGFVPVTSERYDPALNAIHSPWPTAPYASEDWKVLPPDLQVTDFAPILIFEHLALPRMEPLFTSEKGHGPEADFFSDWSKNTDPVAARAFERAFVSFTRATGFANHILRNRTSLRFSIGCQHLLAHYPEIPQDGAGVQAGVLRAQYLGGHVPFRLFPSLVWLDRVKINEQTAWRVFRQPVTRAGHPIGVCQIYPVDQATEARWIST